MVAPSWVGDLVMAQPLVARLRAEAPGRAVDLLAPDWVRGLVSRMPGVSACIPSPFRHGELALGARWRLGRDVARRGYAQAIVLPNSAKSALVPWFAGIARRTGFRGEFRLGLLNDIRPLDPKAVPRLVDRFARLSATPGGPVPDPVLVSTPAQQRVTLDALGLDRSRPVACLCPGAEYGPAKRWPETHFAAAARALQAEGYAVWLLGSAKDRAIAETIATESGPGTTVLAGRTSLEQVVDVLAAADLVVSNDSGLMHIAAALDRPQVALYGSSSPDYTPPLSRRSRIVRHPVPCSPCFARQCPLGHFRCLRDLTPDRVLAEAHSALEDPHA
jgi:heptosyltransferase-2